MMNALVYLLRAVVEQMDHLDHLMPALALWTHSQNYAEKTLIKGEARVVLKSLTGNKTNYSKS